MHPGGEVVSLMSPGFHDPVLQPLYPLLLDRSDVTSAGGFGVLRGEGDFTATAVWNPILPDPGGFYGFSLGYQAGAGFGEGIGVGIANYTPQIAGYLGAPSGLVIAQTKGVQSGGSAVSHEQEELAITPGDVTGQIYMRIAFDDGAGEVTTSFSLDGSSTFITPFAPISSAMTGGGVWVAFGDPISVSPPVRVPALGAGGKVLLCAVLVGAVALLARRRLLPAA